MALDRSSRRLLRLSLAAYWLLIGIMGLLAGERAQSAADAATTAAGLPEAVAPLAVTLLSCLDITLGIWGLSGWRPRHAARVQFTVAALYTVVLSLLTPDLWSDPFGRLAKNIPILATLWLLQRR